MTDLRRGFTGLSAMVQYYVLSKTRSPPTGGCRRLAVRSGQSLWWDGDGLCLFQKRLERGRFTWPQATSGSVALSRAQLSMLLEGIDGRHVECSWVP